MRIISEQDAKATTAKYETISVRKAAVLQFSDAAMEARKRRAEQQKLCARAIPSEKPTVKLPHKDEKATKAGSRSTVQVIS